MLSELQRERALKVIDECGEGLIMASAYGQVIVGNPAHVLTELTILTYSVLEKAHISVDEWCDGLKQCLLLGENQNAE